MESRSDAAVIDADAPQRPEALLEVRNLQTRFHVRDSVIFAVEQATFSVAAGERLGLVGESGSGKSVTALSIMGLIDRPGRVVGGQILYEGRDLLRLQEAEFRKLRGRKLAMIPQNPMAALNPVLTIGDHLREVYHVHLGISPHEADRRSIDLLRQVGLPDPALRLKEYPHRLSGGQRQRVMIALAIACQPQLLIADEPTTALDVTIQAQILDLIDNLASEARLATILITHNLGIVAGHCDRVVVMYAGRVMEIATVEALFRHPRHPYTVGLLRCVPRPTPHRVYRFATIPGSPPVVTELGGGCPFAPRCARVTARCTMEMPPLTSVGPDHLAACWHPAETPFTLGAEA